MASRGSLAKMKPLDQHFQQFKLARDSSPDASSLCEHIILAEFDIDTGSTVRHKYPASVPGYADDWFAEYMLPEGAHNHALDWTVMFLNKGKRTLEDTAANYSSSSSSSSSQDAGVASDDKQHFLYCINLVRKKDDSTVRRGAVVKALAVCSQYHFIEMFRPLLIIALDAYYSSTDPAVLQTLYETLNRADMTAVPRPNPWERKLMRRGVCGRSLGCVPNEHLPQKYTHSMAFEYGTQKVSWCPD